jgi:hypothetical protein
MHGVVRETILYLVMPEIIALPIYRRCAKYKQCNRYANDITFQANGS